MVNLDDLSKIGFGCYRVSDNSREHWNALLYALTMGCNLIDTSTNYMNGESEKLIGNLIRDYSNFDIFIVTKAGYVQGNNLKALEKLNENGLGKDGLISLSDGFKYSIHPDFLKNQIELSCARLQKNQIDGFLLHNPEHYFEQEDLTPSQEEYYARIKKAFEFLEEKVSEGTIRYYGISSNTFPFSTNILNTTNLHRILGIANEVSVNNHFKIIQFPFNLIENEALKEHHGNRSLIELSKANKLITFINRPLNAKKSDGTLRIATYEELIQQLDEKEINGFFMIV